MHASSLKIVQIDGLETDFKSPMTFFNDVQGNRFSVTIGNNSDLNEPYTKPLLIYQDGGIVADQSILREIAPPRWFPGREDTVTEFRIEEVCFRHNHKKFCLQWPFGETTIPILVKAKMSKEAAKLASLQKKGRAGRTGGRAGTGSGKIKRESRASKSRGAAQPYMPTRSGSTRSATAAGFGGGGGKRARTESSQNAGGWDLQSCGMMNSLAWQRIGCEESLGADGRMAFDPHKPIFRCSQCFQCWRSSDHEPRQHTETCPVLGLINACPSYDADSVDTTTIGLMNDYQSTGMAAVASHPTPSLMIPPSCTRTPESLGFSGGMDAFGFSLPNTPMTLPDLSPCASTKSNGLDGDGKKQVVPRQMREVLSKLALEAQCHVWAKDDDRCTEKAIREWAEAEEKGGQGMSMILLTPRRTSSNSWTEGLSEKDLAHELDISGAEDSFGGALPVKIEA